MEYAETELPAGIVTLVIMIVGVLGNLLTIVALLRNNRIRNVTSSFIIGLCIADCVFCATVLPFSATRFLTGSGTQHDILCKLVPFVQYSNVGISLLFITMITINRYIMIAHYSIYNSVYTTCTISCMIAFCIVFSIGMQIPTLLGIWGQYQYDEKLKTCSIMADAAGRSSKSYLMIIGFIIPCIIIVCCYTKIFWIVHSSEKKMLQHATKSQPSNQTISNKKEDKKKRNEWRITKMVLAIFISFVLCYLPLTIVKVIDSDVRYFKLHLISYLMLYASACINPIIYVIMNKQYRKAYKTVLLCQTTYFFNKTSSGNDRL